ncbi:hypothetical protein EDM76_02955 [bacterium]|nr:MAG: hypothetical protein EDM76_02955 [bacterium]
MSRSTRKGPYIHPSLEKKVLAMRNAQQKTIIKTWSRASTFPRAWARSTSCPAAASEPGPETRARAR